MHTWYLISLTDLRRGRFPLHYKYPELVRNRDKGGCGTIPFCSTRNVYLLQNKSPQTVKILVRNKFKRDGNKEKYNRGI